MDGQSERLPDQVQKPLEAPEEATAKHHYRGIPILGHRPTHDAVFSVLSQAPPGSHVLDMGAGAGALSARLADAGYQVQACDLFPEVFQPAGIACHRADLNRRLPFDDNAFDVCVASEVIEHLEAPYRFVRECARILRPGRLLIITLPNFASVSSRVRFFLSGFYSMSARPCNEFEPNAVSDHINPMTCAQVRYMLHTNGFHIRRVLSSNRRYRSIWFYLLYPLARLYTAHAFGKERHPQQRAADRQILRTMFSADVLFGRNLIIAAENLKAE